MNGRKDTYERVTGQIVEAIQAGAGSYRLPWHVRAKDALLPANAATGRPYRGVNVLVLWAEGLRRGYPHQQWATYRQWAELGGQVRRGEKATFVVYWKVTEREEGEEEADPKKGTRLFARDFPVFNAAQVDGYAPRPVPELPPSTRVESAERFFGNLGADVRHGGIEAFYDRAGDYIQLPCYEAFRDPAAYYSTLAHEATHWTGAAHRLARDLSGRFGSAAYAAEELVAELGAAFVCATLGLGTEPRWDHAGYIASWLELLKADKRAIFTAASKAQQAADWMHRCSAEAAAAS